MEWEQRSDSSDRQRQRQQTNRSGLQSAAHRSSIRPLPLHCTHTPLVLAHPLRHRLFQLNKLCTRFLQVRWLAERLAAGGGQWAVSLDWSRAALLAYPTRSCSQSRDSSLLSLALCLTCTLRVC